MASRTVRRLAALALLVGMATTVAAGAWSWAEAYADGQNEIAVKRAQLRSLRELAEARTSFEHLTRASNKPALILAADADPQGALAAAVTHAADGQQVIVDSVEALPAEATLVSATVRLRGTQHGLYAFLHAIDQQTPYLLVPRLEILPFRAADPEHGKPLVLSADIRVAALTAPMVMPRSWAAPTARAQP